MKLRLLLVFVVSFLLNHSTSYAQGEIFAPALNAFKGGKFKQAFFFLRKLQIKEDDLFLKKTYLEALCLNKLKRYDLAIKRFKFIKNKKFTPKEFFFEFGQANFASNNLEEARKAFQASARQNFQKSSSLYYAAYISQILEDYPTAEKNYTLLLKDSMTKRSMRQVAIFQLTQVLLSKLEKVKDKKAVLNYIKKRIIPQLNMALRINPRASVAKDILKRKKELEIKYGLNPLYLINGKKLSPKAHSLSLSQSFKYDTNATTSTESLATLNTMKDSSIFATSINAKYTKPFKRMFTVSPGISLSFTQHGNRVAADVFKNDSLSVTSTLANTYEHKLFGNQASLLFDIEHAYSGADRNSTGKVSKIATSSNGFTVSLGEKFKYFKFGDTTAKAKFKISKSYDDTQHNKVYTFSLNQVAMLPIKHMLIFTHQTDLTRYDTTPASDTNTFLVRFDYVIPEIIRSYTLSFGLSSTFAPTITESTTPERGMEITWNPSVKITKKTTKSLSTTISYNYTKKTSGNIATYAYTKQVTSIDLAYSF
ncbi:hypothetical protein OAK75_13680 [Bacteriovoracales bacterium]|nr:hypothetical protein [Bacteriovoracales bacterium]